MHYSILYLHMLTTEFSVVEKTITHRRSIKPSNFNNKKINDDDINRLLQLAHFAPNHGSTEPWLFKVYKNDALQNFCTAHANLYKQNAGDDFMQSKYDKLAAMGNTASHLIIAIMQRGALPKIPVWEELAAVSCAVQNVLLGAESLGAAGFWSTGGMTTSNALKNYLQLREDDMVVGLLFLGYADHSSYVKQRHSSLSSKVEWML